MDSIVWMEMVVCRCTEELLIESSEDAIKEN